MGHLGPERAEDSHPVRRRQPRIPGGAGYGTVKTFARQLGRANFAQILEQTLQEEKEADQKLSQLADTINEQAREAA